MTSKMITRFWLWHEGSDVSCDQLTAKLEAEGWTFHSMTGGPGTGVMLAFQKPAPLAAVEQYTPKGPQRGEWVTMGVTYNEDVPVQRVQAWRPIP